VVNAVGELEQPAESYVEFVGLDGEAAGDLPGAGAVGGADDAQAGAVGGVEGLREVLVFLDLDAGRYKVIGAQVLVL
jgi:hypothetical protein